MILSKKNILFYLISGCVLLFCSVRTSGQNSSLQTANKLKDEFSFKQDTALELRMRNSITASEPDTNFAWEKYADFLIKVSDTSKYILVPCNEFRSTYNSKKVVIGLRHDLDNDLNYAFQFSDVEYKLGVRSTYFILHTAPYYLANYNNMGVHSESIIPILKTMQDERHFEIGWHNDLVTLQLIYNINPFNFLNNELAWLRTNGINIYGTAAHGSNYCKVYLYMNYYFFNECTNPVVPTRPYNINIPYNGLQVPIVKGNFSDFDLKYEAYYLDFNKYFSDATITYGIRWDIGMLNINDLNPGDRVQILLHPIHWHKGSTEALVSSFRLNGQKASSIDQSNSSINVVMPYGTSKNALTATFVLSPGAYAKVLSHRQTNGSSVNNFTEQVVYRVYAENRNFTRDYTVNVSIAKNSLADFEYFNLSGIAKSVTINKTLKTISVKVPETAEINSVIAEYRLSAGASARIGNMEQQSGEGSIDFSTGVIYKITAEDGTVSNWQISIIKEENQANFISFEFPGMVGNAVIDTLNNSIFAEINPLTFNRTITVSFIISEGAKLYLNGNVINSGIDKLDLATPLIVEVSSKDNMRKKSWTISIKSSVVSDAKDEIQGKNGNIVMVFPNPTTGKLNIFTGNIKEQELKIDVIDLYGKKVWSGIIATTDSGISEIDLSALPQGVYLLRYSKTENPLRIVILNR